MTGQAAETYVVGMPTSSLALLDSLLARDAMHAPIVACGPDTALDRVAKLMAEHRVHAVVVDGILDNRLVWGVVTDLDLIRVALNEFAPASAGEAARTEALTVDADDDLALVGRRLVEHGCSHAIVLEDGMPAGVVSTLDLASALAAS
jgi:CBS domain-containing protein